MVPYPGATLPHYIPLQAAVVFPCIPSRSQQQFCSPHRHTATYFGRQLPHVTDCSGKGVVANIWHEETGVGQSFAKCLACSDREEAKALGRQSCWLTCSVIPSWGCSPSTVNSTLQNVVLFLFILPSLHNASLRASCNTLVVIDFKSCCLWLQLHIDDTADAFAVMHVAESLVDLIEGRVVSNILVNKDLPFQIVFHDSWQLCSPFYAAKG